MSEHRRHGSWAVWINDTDRNHNGQPFRLDVRPANGSHVTDEDAEWLRKIIRQSTNEARCDHNVIPIRIRFRSRWICVRCDQVFRKPPERHVVMDVATFTRLLNGEES